MKKTFLFTTILVSSSLLFGCKAKQIKELSQSNSELSLQLEALLNQMSKLQDKYDALNSSVNELNEKNSGINQVTPMDGGQETPTSVVYTFDMFKRAMNNSKPTKVSTTQTYSILSENITLNANTQLVICYGSEVKSVYTYSYEKLNELVTGNESMISVVSGSVYSNGSEVGDGVNFVSEAESIINIRSIDFSEDFLEFSIKSNKLTATVKDSYLVDFFTNDYGIKEVSFAMGINEKCELLSLDLSFKTNEYMDNLFFGVVQSHTTYSYQLETIN